MVKFANLLAKTWEMDYLNPMNKTTNEVYRFVISPVQPDDPRSMGLLADARALGVRGVTRIICHDLYFLEGQVNDPDLGRIASELLSDPITQTAQWGRLFFTREKPAQAAANCRSCLTARYHRSGGRTNPEGVC